MESEATSTNTKPKTMKTGWVVFWLVICFPVGLILMWSKTKWTNRTKWIVTAVIIGLIFLGSLNKPTSSQDIATSATQNKPTAEAMPTSTPQPTPPPTTVSTGLGVTRQYIIDSLNKGAEAGGQKDFQFEQGVSIKGKDNYTASSGQNLVQLIGPADNLSEASSTAFIGDSTGDNMIALVYIVGLANVIDPNSQGWITNTMKEVGDTDQDSKKWSTIINNKKFELDMNTIGTVKTLTLTIDPA